MHAQEAAALKKIPNKGPKEGFGYKTLESTREDRNEDVESVREALKGKEMSDVLALGFDKNMAVRSSIENGVVVYKQYPQTLDELKDIIRKKLWIEKDNMNALRPDRRPGRLYVRSSSYSDGKETIETREIKGSEVRDEVESAKKEIARLRAELDETRSSRETENRRVAHFSLDEVLGTRDAAAARTIPEKRKGLVKTSEKLTWMTMSIRSRLEDGLRQNSSGERGTSLPEEIKDLKSAEDLEVELQNIEDGLYDEPLLNEHLFIEQHVLAAAGKKHKKALVEDFEPEQIEAKYQEYQTKLEDFRKKFQPLYDKYAEDKEEEPDQY